MRINYSLRTACVSMLLIVLALFGSTQRSFSQSAGFNSSYAVFSINGGGDSYYCMPSNTSCGVNPSLDGASLGSYTIAATPIHSYLKGLNITCLNAAAPILLLPTLITGSIKQVIRREVLFLLVSDSLAVSIMVVVGKTNNGRTLPKM